VDTVVSAEALTALNEALVSWPDGFEPNAKLARQLERRRAAFGPDGGIDWAHAEALAFASLLTEGVPLRLTGQDTERGTFSQRHLMLHDARTGQHYAPIQNLPGALAPMELHNSPLSELACVGFEYGYSVAAPEALVLWEAQFGDFVNAAQVIIDQFMAAGLSKWGQTSRLTLLLPHGYEGQGPEHSSARLERFLQLAAENNLRVANCTTPAQYFHLLRRQARRDRLRPLVVMTPKSLLRHPFTASTPKELAEGRFLRVIDDLEAAAQAAKVRRLVLCSGKIAVDLFTSERRKDNPQVAVVRVEQLYPFPADLITDVLERYANVREVCWVQEEPENMGAWEFVRPEIESLIERRWPLRYIGRSRNSSPSEGSSSWHAANQRAIVDQVFEAKAETRELDRVLSKQV